MLLDRFRACRGTEEIGPTRASRNTQPVELRFCALLGDEPNLKLTLV